MYNVFCRAYMMMYFKIMYCTMVVQQFIKHALYTSVVTSALQFVMHTCTHINLTRHFRFMKVYMPLINQMMRVSRFVVLHVHTHMCMHDAYLPYFSVKVNVYILYITCICKPFKIIFYSAGLQCSRKNSEPAALQVPARIK